jgi:hypothetical protein
MVAKHSSAGVDDFHPTRINPLFHRGMAYLSFHLLKQLGMLTTGGPKASYGNVGDTDAHINGLINAVNLLSPLDDDFCSRTGLDEELANRYLLL